jgi:uncharacterized membrane-anchored protein
MSNKIVLVALVIILVLVNGSIFAKEKHLAGGKLVYLQLMPVDPRSLMQGDYMALRFRLADDVYRALPKSKDHKRWRGGVIASDGDVLVRLDARGIASFKGLYKGKGQVLENEIIMHYRVRNGAVKFATNAFFFQEGDGSYYQAARYGQFRVDKAGELLLAGMYDEELKHLLADKVKEAGIVQ